TLDYGTGVKILDAATGRTLFTADGTEGAEEIVVDGTDLICVSRLQQRRSNAHARITCFDLSKNKIAWQVKDARCIPQLTSVSGDAVVYHNAKQVVCLDRATGEKRWVFANPRSLQGKDNMMLLADGKVIIASSKKIEAVSIQDGKKAWTAPGSSGKSMRGYDIFVARGQVFANASGNLIAGYDLHTGKKTTHIDPTSVQSQGHHLRCYRAKATENFLITQFRGVEFLSLDNETPHKQNDWLRGSCTYGVMPANGFLYQPPHGCFCNAAAMQKGFNAYAGPVPSVPDHQPVVDQPGPLEKGPAYGHLDAADQDDPKSWTGYRRDQRRAGATTNQVKGELDRRWKVNLGTDVTPPVAAKGRVFVAAKAHHAIHALDGKTGEQLWSFAAGAPIDSPPSLHRGLLVFGCADGYFYCIRADNGQLAWRRRLAPAERWIVDHGQLESVWRLHGSPTVVGDLAYCVAGRSSFVDGGLFLTAIEITTGAVKHRASLYTGSDEREDRKRNEFVAAYHIEGAHSDLLVAEGGFIYLNQMKFSPDLKLQPTRYLSKEEITKRPSINLDGKDYVNDDIFKVRWRNI
ncbi:MAG: PQQ-like beta-propeller repeat protein, partial [Planctomycetales bacterium]